MDKRAKYKDILMGFISLYGDEWNRLPIFTKLNVRLGCFLSSHGICRYNFIIPLTIFMSIYTILKIGDLMPTVKMAVRLSLVLICITGYVILRYMENVLIFHMEISEHLSYVVDTYTKVVAVMENNTPDVKMAEMTKLYDEYRSEMKELLLIKYTKL